MWIPRMHTRFFVKSGALAHNGPNGNVGTEVVHILDSLLQENQWGNSTRYGEGSIDRGTASWWRVRHFSNLDLNFVHSKSKDNVLFSCAQPWFAGFPTIPIYILEKPSFAHMINLQTEDLKAFQTCWFDVWHFDAAPKPRHGERRRKKDPRIPWARCSALKARTWLWQSLTWRWILEIFVRNQK